MSCQEPSALNHLQGWRLDNPSEQSVRVLSHPHSKNPDVSSCSITLVFQFVPIAPLTSLDLLVTLLRQPRTLLSLFYHKSSWLAHVHLGAHQHEHRLFCRHPFQPGSLSGSWGCSSPCAAPSTLPLVELHEAPASQLLQPVRDSLDGTRTLWCFSHSSQFGATS